MSVKKAMFLIAVMTLGFCFFTDSKAYALTTGENYADALAGGALAAKRSAPMVFLDSNTGNQAQSLYNDRTVKYNMFSLTGRNLV